MSNKTTVKDQQAAINRVERLYAEHNALLVLYVEKIVRSKDDAREIAQEAYARLLALKAEHSVEHWRSYLFRVAHNIAIDRIKQSSRYNKRIELIRSQVSEDDEAQMTEAPDGQLAAQQLSHKFEALLAQLPAKCSQAFRLYRLEGKSYQEIAALMEVSESMIRKHVIRALLHCKNSMLQRD